MIIQKNAVSLQRQDERSGYPGDIPARGKPLSTLPILKSCRSTMALYFSSKVTILNKMNKKVPLPEQQGLMDHGVGSIDHLSRQII